MIPATSPPAASVISQGKTWPVFQPATQYSSTNFRVTSTLGCTLQETKRATSGSCAYVEKIAAASSITGRRRRSRSVSMTSGGFMARCRSRASSWPPPEGSALRECLSSVLELGRMRCVNVELPYGETTLTATLPSRTRTLSNVEATTLAPLEDLGAAVRAALAAPRGLPRIGELVRPGAGVTIAFDDATVASYGPIRSVAIEAVLEELEAAGGPRTRVTLICAHALHPKPRPAGRARILGEDLPRAFGPRLVCHDAEDQAAIVDLGRTPEHGYPVEVHRLVAESDLTVYVNARYNRGFHGGWKSVCVGLSTYDSIKVTHTPDGMSMSVHGNRMHEVLDEMGRHLERRVGRRVFKIDTLLADPWRPAKVVAGSVDATRRELLGDVARMFPARRGQAGERFDVLVYGVPDTSPYAVFSHVNPILTLVSSGLGYLGGLAEAAGSPGRTRVIAAPPPPPPGPPAPPPSPAGRESLPPGPPRPHPSH